MTSCTELMQTIFPAAREIPFTTPHDLKQRIASCAHRKLPGIDCDDKVPWSSVISSKGASFCSPELLIRVTMAPNCLTIFSNISMTCGSRETSAQWAWTGFHIDVCSE